MSETKLLNEKAATLRTHSEHLHRRLRIQIERMDCLQISIMFSSPLFTSHIDSDNHGCGGKPVRQDNRNDIIFSSSQASKFDDERRNVFRCVELL